MFRVLGLTPGHDFSVTGAAVLAGTQPDTARQILDRLAGAALLSEHAPGRYAFHDLLRLFASECAYELDERARDTATDRYFEWCVGGVDAAARRLYPYLARLPYTTSDDAGPSVPAVRFDDGEQASVWLQAEWANLSAVVTHSAAHGPRRVAWLLADSLRGHCWMCVSPIEWRMVAEAGVLAANAEGDLRVRAACHQNLGELSRRCSQHQEAVEQYAQAARLSKAAGWLTGRAKAVSGLCATYWTMGESQKAADYAHEALELSHELGLATSQSFALAFLGMICRTMGRLTEAAEYHQQALILDRESGNPVYESMNLTDLGAVYHALGRSDEALDCLDQALQCLEHRDRQGDTYNSLAVVHRDLRPPRPGTRLRENCAAPGP